MKPFVSIFSIIFSKVYKKRKFFMFDNNFFSYFAFFLKSVF